MKYYNLYNTKTDIICWFWNKIINLYIVAVLKPRHVITILYSYIDLYCVNIIFPSSYCYKEDFRLWMNIIVLIKKLNGGGVLWRERGEIASSQTVVCSTKVPFSAMRGPIPVWHQSTVFDVRLVFAELPQIKHTSSHSWSILMAHLCSQSAFKHVVGVEVLHCELSRHNVHNL